MAEPHDVRPDLHELSPWSMFLSADALVKAVIIGLALASLIAWTVFFAKAILIKTSQRQLQRSARRYVFPAEDLPEAGLGMGPKPNLLSRLLAARGEEEQFRGRVQPETASKSARHPVLPGSSAQIQCDAPGHGCACDGTCQRLLRRTFRNSMGHHWLHGI